MTVWCPNDNSEAAGWSVSLELQEGGGGGSDEQPPVSPLASASSPYSTLTASSEAADEGSDEGEKSVPKLLLSVALGARSDPTRDTEELGLWAAAVDGLNHKVPLRRT